MTDAIRKILEIAVHAPSGENTQPWRFAAKGNQIYQYNIPERDNSLYNFDQKGSLTAHGTVIENIVIASPKFGYKASVTLFPDRNNQNLIAMLTLYPTTEQEDPLYSYILKRNTNRKPYKPISLTKEQLDYLANLSKIVSNGEIRFVSDPQKMQIIAEAGSINERVMFNNRLLHGFFFSHLNWTQEEEETKRTGFYIKTLELPPPAQIGMKLFKYWPVMKSLNFLGLSKLIAMGNAKTYASSSAMGAVIMQNENLGDFVNAGRILQRIWLEATKMGLSMQPITGVLFFAQKLKAGGADGFANYQVSLIQGAYKKIKEAYGINEKKVIVVFRMGYGGDPSAHSLKLPPTIIEE
ncbi:MAG: nitroreductase family protein [bacterium]|nr:nitroreductase family protein [bacterium]